MEPVTALRRFRLALAAAAFACISACAPRAQRDDAGRVSAILTALAARNLASVASEFTPDAAAQLGDRVRVGMLHDRILALGALKGVAPLPGSTPGDRETFAAAFERGEREVDVTVAPDGKFAAFWVHPHGGS